MAMTLFPTAESGTGAGGVSVVVIETGLPSLNVKKPTVLPSPSVPTGRPFSKSSIIW
jgi:hypothetical protein